MMSINETLVVINSSVEKKTLIKLVTVFEKFNKELDCPVIFGWDNKNYFIVTSREIMIGNAEMTISLHSKEVQSLFDLDETVKSDIKKFVFNNIDAMHVSPESINSAALKRNTWLEGHAF